MLDLLVIGGGVMGLFTAYHASARLERVAVLERGTSATRPPRPTAGPGPTARTTSTPVYARFADEAIRLWTEFEQATGTRRAGALRLHEHRQRSR